MARGSIKQRSPGTWSIVVELPRDSVTGKRKQKRETIRGTKREAGKRLAELLYQLNTGAYVDPSNQLLAAYVEGWLRDYVWPNLAPMTAQVYEHMARKHLLPALGHYAMSQLRPEHIQHYLADKLAGGLSSSTVRHHYVTLNTCLNHAVKHELLARNPCASVTAPKSQSPEMSILDQQGALQILEAAKETEYYALFYFLLHTGCRRSEALAVRWADLDLTLGQVSIKRSLHCLKGGALVYRPPKTAKSRRLVTLTPSLAQVLREHHRACEAQLKVLGVQPADDALVFCRADGGPYLPDTITQVWTRLARKVGLRGVRLHDARHAHATLMLQRGVHPKIVQERMGHASIQHTLDIYSHVTPGLQEAAALRFDEGFDKHAEGDVGQSAVTNP